MGSSTKYTIEQYSNDTALNDIQFESIEIKKSGNIKAFPKANLRGELGVEFNSSETTSSINMKLIVSVIAEGRTEEDEIFILFNSKIIVNSNFSINFEHDSSNLLKDLKNDIFCQKVFIGQIVPVVSENLKANLGKMGFSDIPLSAVFSNITPRKKT